MLQPHHDRKWADIRLYQSENERVNALADWLHTYNHHRDYTAIGGPPSSRATNLKRQDI